MWKEINNCMAENYFMNNEDKTEDVWKTPRESWHTTCDGYIDTNNIADADGYSKIIKPRKYDKIVTEKGTCSLNERNPLSLTSHITLSYSKVKFQSNIHNKNGQTGSENEKNLSSWKSYPTSSSISSNIWRIHFSQLPIAPIILMLFVGNWKSETRAGKVFRSKLTIVQLMSLLLHTKELNTTQMTILQKQSKYQNINIFFSKSHRRHSKR